MRILTALEQVIFLREAAFPVDPYYEVALHEIGHVFDHMGAGRARNHVMEALADMYLNKYPDRGEDHDFYNHWLRSQFPSQSYQWQDYQREINPAELLAQAFADVELDADPSEAAVMAHKLLMDESQEHTSRYLRQDMSKGEVEDWRGEKSIDPAGKAWEYKRQYGMPYDPEHFQEHPPGRTRYVPYARGHGYPGEGHGLARVPEGFHRAVSDMKVKYPHLDIHRVEVGHEDPDEPKLDAIAWTTMDDNQTSGQRPSLGIGLQATDPDVLNDAFQKKVDSGNLSPWYNDPNTGPMPNQEAEHYLNEIKGGP